MTEKQLIRKLKSGYFTLKELGVKSIAITALRNKGFRIVHRGHNRSKKYSMLIGNESLSLFVSKKSRKVQEVRWCELSDLHAGSKQFDREGLRHVLQVAYDQGYTDVHISGDLCDGVGVYRGHATNLRFWSAQEQADELIDIFNDFPMRYIATKGNHCYSFELKGGTNPIQLIAEQVENFTFLDTFAADLIICGVVKRMVHGASGRAYALSYPGQTYVRDLLNSSGEDVWLNGRKYRLRFIQMGHYHSFLTYESAGIIISHSGNFQFPNDYTLRKGLVGPQGGRLVKALIKNGKVLEYTTSFIKPR